VRQLYTVGPRIAVIGAEGIGKTELLRRFVGDLPSAARSGATTTIGIRAYDKRVAITGSAAASTSVVLYEVQGHRRYAELRKLCVDNCHAVLVCYDADKEASLAEAKAQVARLGLAKEGLSNSNKRGGMQNRPSVPRLGRGFVADSAPFAPSPAVVVCGISRGGGRPSGRERRLAASSAPTLSEGGRQLSHLDGESVCPGCAASLVVDVARGTEAVEAAVQAVVDALAARKATLLPHPSVLDVLYNQA